MRSRLFSLSVASALLLVCGMGLASAFDEGDALRTRTYGVFGDGGSWNARAQSVEQSLKKAAVSELILLGDNAYNQTYEQAWGAWIKAGFHFPVVAIGNHHNGYANEVRFFGVPGEFYTRELTPGVLAIVLNSDNVPNADLQADFLEETLRETTAQSVFVIYHHPSLTLIKGHPWQAKEVFQTRMHEILARYRSKISAVLNGHEHMAGVFSFDSLPVIVSGAVKEALPFRATNGVQAGIRVKTEWGYSAEPTWVRLIVQDRSVDSLIEFIDAKTNRVTCRIRLQTGARVFLESICYSPRG